jgi:hypothetical protein
LNRQDAKCAKATPNEATKIGLHFPRSHFSSVSLGELGVLAVKKPLHSGYCHPFSLVPRKTQYGRWKDVKGCAFAPCSEEF